MLSRNAGCSWSSADRRCSNYIRVINNFVAYYYIRDLTLTYRCYIAWIWDWPSTYHGQPAREAPHIWHHPWEFFNGALTLSHRRLQHILWSQFFRELPLMWSVFNLVEPRRSGKVSRWLSLVSRRLIFGRDSIPSAKYNPLEPVLRCPIVFATLDKLLSAGNSLFWTFRFHKIGNHADETLVNTSNFKFPKSNATSVDGNFIILASANLLPHIRMCHKLVKRSKCSRVKAVTFCIPNTNQSRFMDFDATTKSSGNMDKMQKPLEKKSSLSL